MRPFLTHHEAAKQVIGKMRLPLKALRSLQEDAAAIDAQQLQAHSIAEQLTLLDTLDQSLRDILAQGDEFIRDETSPVLLKITICLDNLEQLEQAHTTTTASLRTIYDDFLANFEIDKVDKAILETHMPHKIEVLTKPRKTVYIHLFQVEMDHLGNRKSRQLFLECMLESLPFTESHGLAIYASEEDVRAALYGKDGHHGYLAVEVDEELDVTKQREPRFDHNQKPLIIIPDGSIKQTDIIAFYHDKDTFVLENGELVLKEAR